MLLCLTLTRWLRTRRREGGERGVKERDRCVKGDEGGKGKGMERKGDGMEERKGGETRLQKIEVGEKKLLMVKKKMPSGKKKKQILKKGMWLNKKY